MYTVSGFSHKTDCGGEKIAKIAHVLISFGIGIFFPFYLRQPIVAHLLLINLSNIGDQIQNTARVTPIEN